MLGLHNGVRISRIFPMLSLTLLLSHLFTAKRLQFIENCWFVALAEGGPPPLFLPLSPVARVRFPVLRPVQGPDWAFETEIPSWASF